MVSNPITYVDLSSGKLSGGDGYSTLYVKRANQKSGHSYYANTDGPRGENYIRRVTMFRAIWQEFTRRNMLIIFQRKMYDITHKDECLSCSEADNCALAHAKLTALFEDSARAGLDNQYASIPADDSADDDDDNDSADDDNDADDFFGDFVRGLMAHMDDNSDDNDGLPF